MGESILGAVVNFVGEKLLQCIAEPIKRRYNYLRCYKSNIEKLGEEARNLEDARDELQMRVTIAENNAEVIVPAVNTWFDDVKKIQVEKTGIESEITNTQSGCFAVKSRVSLSKKAIDTVGAMKELQDRYRSFNRISNPAPPPLIPTGAIYDFQSRKQIEEDIMEALRDKEVNNVGICGMGGVGKTTMAERVKYRAKKEGLFDETVKIVVSQKIDMFKIQNEIAEQLGLKLDEEGSESRKSKLYTRLASGKKRILIVIDDVWDYLELKELGIPCEKGFNECTILLTSRDRDVLNQMDVQKVCEVQTLSEMEAWSFFKQKVGTCVDDEKLLSTAQEVAKQCKGLPVALVNVAMALKVKEDKRIWKNALHKLKVLTRKVCHEFLKKFIIPKAQL